MKFELIETIKRKKWMSVIKIALENNKKRTCKITEKESKN